MSDEVIKISKKLQELQRSHFFGSVTLSFQDGRIPTMKVEQVVKVNEMP